jgi:asparagine synthase (glutamine-hydrolysing)
MKNRGPDHQACVGFTVGDQRIQLLHARLSIIDLDPRSNQPFTISDTTIVYNGEIYNYVELRQTLLDDGVELRTDSDTEVLLHYYRRHGEDCVKHFEGMWSFAIFDAGKGSLFLSRDRYAEKPLYYMELPEGFFFASEVKFLRALLGRSLAVNHNHLLRGLMHGYKSLYKTDETYFEEVRELKYAQNLTLVPGGKIEPRRYWKPSCDIDESMSLEDAIAGTRERLLESVRIRLRADVPLAFCLSGGVDSASLVSIAAKEFNAKLHTFSIIDTDERYNEEENIMATVHDVACPHSLIAVSQENPLGRLKKLIEYHDAPIGTISYYVHSLISEQVSKIGYRVTFSGTSADELYTGYYDHFLLHLNEMRGRDDYDYYLNTWQEHIGEFIRNPILKNANLYRDDPNFREHIFDGNAELQPYLCKPWTEPYQEAMFTGNLLRNRMFNELFHEVTPMILHEDDLNSMFYSIENRSPYLDTRLQQFAYSIPPQHLIREGFGKHVLREAVSGILNDQVRLDRRKKGFNASINSIFDLRDAEVRDYLLNPQAGVFEIIDRDKLEQLFDQFPIPNHLSKFIFNFINARMFLEIN